MLPGNALPNTVGPATLLEPDNLPRPARTVDYERGGIALNDASQGLQVQNWRARVDGDNVLIGPDPYTSETIVLAIPGIVELSLAFDQNMNPALAYVTGAQAYLWWYSTALEAMTTTTLAADVKSPTLTMDDKRAFSTSLALNDVLLFYVRGSTLYYRQQRESYGTERSLQTFSGANVRIKSAGMNVGLRMQVEMVGFDVA